MKSVYQAIKKNWFNEDTSVVEKEDKFLYTEVPLAATNENSLSRNEDLDWRLFFSEKLSGDGLEIGPLHRPMIKHDGMNIKYVDRCTVSDLRQHYPELIDFPLVEPDILDNAETLSTVKDQSFDFLISAHVIEHMKNPISSLKEWCRVVKPGGLIYLIVPDKRITFDKLRVRTSLAHMVLDYLSPSDERDFEHYLDYAVNVHNMIDPKDAVEEAQRLIDTDYSIHYHVFQPSDMTNLLNWFSKNIRPISIIEGPNQSPHNQLQNNQFQGSDEFHYLIKLV